MFHTICMHQFRWLSERGGYFLKFASESGGYPERGDSLRKGGGSNPGGNYDEELISCWKYQK